MIMFINYYIKKIQILFIQSIESFIKEKAALDKEYSKKLSSLVNKYRIRTNPWTKSWKNKSSNSNDNSERYKQYQENKFHHTKLLSKVQCRDSIPRGSSAGDNCEDEITFHKAWFSLLDYTEFNSKCHLNLSNSLTSSVLTSIPSQSSSLPIPFVPPQTKLFSLSRHPPPSSHEIIATHADKNTKLGVKLETSTLSVPLLSMTVSNFRRRITERSQSLKAECNLLTDLLQKKTKTYFDACDLVERSRLKWLRSRNIS